MTTGKYALNNHKRKKTDMKTIDSVLLALKEKKKPQLSEYTHIFGGSKRTWKKIPEYGLKLISAWRDDA